MLGTTSEEHVIRQPPDCFDGVFGEKNVTAVKEINFVKFPVTKEGGWHVEDELTPT